jgi:hypothetical protein
MLSSEHIVPVAPAISETMENDNIWNSCCGSHIDKRSAQFFSGLVISVMVLAMSIAKVLLEPEKPNTVYINLIVLILGIYTPTPSIQAASKR